MAFTVSVHHGPFLLVVATGEGLVGDVMGMIDFAAKVAAFQSCNRILFDTAGAEMTLTPEEATAAGAHAARKLSGAQVAFVVAARPTGGAGEKAARAGGLQLSTFTSLKAATDWLGG
jgi:hypothetical protein